MPAKPVTIGLRKFPRQQDALKFFSDMLTRYNAGDRVAEDDAIDLNALLKRHIDVDKKVGVGVDYFKVDKDGYGYKCFWIVRVDSSQVDFTYKTKKGVRFIFPMFRVASVAGRAVGR